jgi:uncharacterized protein (DUF1330 family)
MIADPGSRGFRRRGSQRNCTPRLAPSVVLRPASPIVCKPRIPPLGPLIRPVRRFPVVPACVILETDITDREQYEKYKAASPGAIAGGGGRFLVRGGELAVLESDWQPSRLVVLEFKDLAAAKRWYKSEAYQEAKELREGAPTCA